MELRRVAILAVTLSLIGSVALVAITFDRTQAIQDMQDIAGGLMRAQITALSPVIKEIQDNVGELDKKFRSLAFVPTEDGQYMEIPELVELGERIDLLEKQSAALRQAFNSTKPEEVLTIARIADEVRLLRFQINDLASDLSTQQSAFEQSVLREVQSARKSGYWIAGILFSLASGLLMSVLRGS